MEFSRGMLRVVVAQICHTLGWNGIQTTPLELLTDILERYLMELGKTTHRYSEQAGRIEPNLDDLALAFQDIGMSMGELQDYVKHIEPVPAVCKVPQYPVPTENALNFPSAQCREILQRDENMEHVHSHLPIMYPNLAEDLDPKPLSPPAKENNSVNGSGEDSSTQISPFTAGEKRPFLSPGESPPVKRLRTLPDEIYHSQYEMTSVSMTMSGVLTPTRGIGKLPDARTPPQSLRSVPTSVSGKEKEKVKEKTKEKITSQDSSTGEHKRPSVVSIGSGNKDKIKNKNSGSSSKKKSLNSKNSSGKIKSSSGGLKIKSKKIKLSGEFIRKSEHSENLNKEGKSEFKIKKLKDSKKLLKKSKDHTKPVKLKSKSLSSSKKKSKSGNSLTRVKPTVNTDSASVSATNSSNMSSLKTLLSQDPLKVEPPSPKRMVAPPSPPMPKPATPEPPRSPSPPPVPLPQPQEVPGHSSVTPVDSPLQPVTQSPPSSPSQVPPPAVEHEEEVISMLIKRPPSPSLPLPPRPLDDSSDSEDTPELKLIIEEDPQESPSIKEARLSSYDNIIDSVIRDSEKMMKEEDEKKLEETKEKERKEELARQRAEDREAREASIMESIESVIAQGQESDSVKDVYDFDDDLEDKKNKPPPSPVVTPIKPLNKSPAVAEKKTKKKKLKIKTGQNEEEGNTKNVKSKLKEKLQAKKEASPEISSPEWPKVQLEKVDINMVKKFEFPSPKKQKSPASSSVYSHTATADVFTFSSEQAENKGDVAKKEKRKDKEKKKKNKDKDKDRDRKEKKKDKEKHKKDKHKDKHKHRDEVGPPIPKLTLKFGGLGGGTPTSTVITSEPSRHHSVKIESRSPQHKLEIPKLVIKKPVMPQSKPTAILQSPKSLPSPKVTLSPTKSSPQKPSPPKRLPSPPPVKRLPSPPPRVLSPSPPSSPSPAPSPVPPARSPSPAPSSPSPARPMFTPSPPATSPSPDYPAIHIPQPSPSPSPPPARSPSPPPPKRSPSPPPPARRSPSPSPVLHSPTPSPQPAAPPPGKSADIPPPPPGSSQVLQKRATVITETVGTITDPVTGEKIWICPGCKLPDDGSAMIGCDKCDDWYHWPCVGIKVEPAETEQWYCPRCSVGKSKQTKKKNVRKKKKT